MIETFSFSEVGGHLENEDGFVVEQHPDDPACWICTLADGQGGRAGGGRAARIASQIVMEMAKRQPASCLVDIRIWERLLDGADAMVAKDSMAGFTTLIGFCVLKERIIGGSNGDSAVAIFDEKRECLELTGNQMKNPPVGSGNVPFVTFATNMEKPWLVVAMSDGVWKYVGWDRLRDAVRKHRGQELITALQGFARLPRTGEFQDDFTVVVLQNDDNSQPETMRKPWKPLSPTTTR